MELHSDRATARIDLAGGRLASLVVDGHELLVTEGEKPTRWGSFPMVPWAGRLPYGKLEFAGQVYVFPLSSPPHANHGVAHLNPWIDRGDGLIEQHLDAPWPFGGIVQQRFAIDDTSLHVSISVENQESAMPAMAGWHPWFRRVLDDGSVASLDVEPGRRYELDHDMIPTGRLVDVSLPPWNETFVELAADPVITWGETMRLEISSTFDHWVIFTEPEHALCVEPQSGPPNQINAAPYLVEPGCPLQGSMTLRFG